MPSDPYVFPEDFDPANFIIDSDEIIIKEDEVLRLEKALDELIHKAKYYQREVTLADFLLIRDYLREVRQTARRP